MILLTIAAGALFVACGVLAVWVILISMRVLFEEPEEEDTEPACPDGVCDGSGLVPNYSMEDGEFVPDGVKACICKTL